MDGNWWIPSGRVLLRSGRGYADPALPQQELAHRAQHFFLPRRIRDPFRPDQNRAGRRTTRYDLLVDAAPATRWATPSTAANDYRVLQPRLVTDPNRNRTAVAFDALGMVVATAVMGKAGRDRSATLLDDFDADPPLAESASLHRRPARPQAASLLGKATTRIVYDLERYQRTGQPPFAATLARETHCRDPAGGRTEDPDQLLLLRRLRPRDPEEDPGRARARRARAGRTSIRAGSGSGWTVFNNKGKPVRQYEPFFSATHRLRVRRDRHGVSSDAVLRPGRARGRHAASQPHLGEGGVRSLAAGDLGCQRHGRSIADPKTDPDVGDFFRRLAGRRSICPTWHARSGSAGAAGDRRAQMPRQKSRRPCRHADRRPPRLARPHLPDRRAQRFTRDAGTTRPSTCSSPPASSSTSKATSARSSTPRTASSCATTTTCSAIAFIRPAWRRASAGC